ncbi:type I glyceraldehyde-3-phosphate dehydrogenase [Desulfobacter hydrogenophilus]|uniref:Glyceraldehyde-3-phosphate dehydrogenase n=1 Tax=Desulfobacter hydrogenophilus TaxID=2291 RepID=A0A328F9C3_9BACT|nr:type I glyceraldehyde-3-phosphate dehydrogenase [Desulfobacter hydrogenophilus]NDY71324.1 type I glyceraldehyde-3-phosphate dehydrogenase [Desulfobacter hydrogenophilus]QBH12277.1 type I glyceraldehyde-3-phosphate dehydrogenase [Desulfobacter hydrogenophilus]RAM01211.1 type I glyceraldehyde-3-phosphate dehydrogenase [Desulfobacter hydrogenophilus]
MKKVAINGLGRIGRLVLRHYLSNPPKNLQIVAANDLTPTDELAYLLRYDSVQGRASFPIESSQDYLELGSQKVAVFNEKDPVNLPWKALGVDVVLECTGLFRKREDAAKHLESGASKVIISAPSENADLTIVMGVNEKLYDSQKHHVISNASCTTNSLAPVVKVLNDTFGIENLMVTTIHAYTASQALVDRPARKRRRGRAAAASLIPSTTGAAKATALVIPELKGRMDAIAVRAPIPDGALTDIVAYLKKDVSVETVNSVLRNAAGGALKGIIDYNDDEIVSADIIGNPHSGIVDAPSTRVVMNRVAKVLIWYDNEFGYARRMLDLAAYV